MMYVLVAEQGIWTVRTDWELRELYSRFRQSARH
jgi:hypothetical protein